MKKNCYNRVIKKFISSSFLFLPNIMFAQITTWSSYDTFELVLSIINVIVVVIIAISVYFFLNNFVRYIKLMKNDVNREHNRKLMIRCVITVIIMVFIWQITHFINQKTCCVGTNTNLVPTESL